MSYRWTHRQPLTRLGGENIEPGEEFEPTEAELQSFGDVIEAVEDEAGSDGEEADSEASEGDGDEVPLEEKDYSELRSMAVDADTDEIDGRSSKDEIVAYFSE